MWDIGLEIAAGEITAVLGQSESGKTALVRVLAGVEEPTKGAISFGGAGSAPGRLVSAALSRPGLAPELTVFENLEMFAALWNVPGNRRTREISFILELLGLSGIRASRAHTLSNGARQRLEIGRALIADAPVTLIDSLLDTLDRIILERLWDYILKLRREENRSFVIFTSRGRIAELCGKITVMHRGRMVFIGRPDDFRRAAGEDMVVIGDISNQAVKNKISERMSVIIKEEEGFLSFKVSNGERAVTELMSEFGSDLNCVYLKRPTLDDALDVITSGQNGYIVETSKGS